MNLFGFVIAVILFIFGVGAGFIFGVGYAITNKKNEIEKAAEKMVKDKENKNG